MQVGEGFECARQTATIRQTARKKQRGKNNFLLSSRLLGFSFRIRFIIYFGLV
jgi:hypothetical protein